MRLEGKVALVTGAGSGIGRATALVFADSGADLVLADINGDSAQAVSREVETRGRRALPVRVDVANPLEVEAMAKQLADRFGRLDILFNNAGIEGRLPPVPIEQTSIEDWNRLIGINLTGMFLVIKHAVPLLKASGGGAIVNNASILGLVGFAMAPAYSASKGGIIQLTKSLALELAPAHIRVNAVAPGFIETPMVDRFMQTSAGAQQLHDQLAMLHPLRRLGQPEEIGKAVLFLASEDASFVTGAVLAVDGGYTAQ